MDRRFFIDSVRRLLAKETFLVQIRVSGVSWVAQHSAAFFDLGGGGNHTGEALKLRRSDGIPRPPRVLGVDLRQE